MKDVLARLKEADVTRIFKIRNFFFLFLLLCSLFPAFALAAEETVCAVHVHSSRSSGEKSIAEIAKIARNRKIDAVIMTDLLAEDYSYGIGPFRKWMKKTAGRRSIFETGVMSYLQEIEEAGRAVPEVVMIDGAAVTPFYYWTGNVWQGRLVLNDRGKDMLVLGLGDAAGYQNLPVLGTGKSRFSSYQPAPERAMPYQDVINYINARGGKGLVYWSHPLAGERRDFSLFGFTVSLQSNAVDSELMETGGYTGMGIYAVELSQIMGAETPTYMSPGGKWDRLLMQYSSGRRDRPAWAIGEVDYNGIAGANNDLGAILNVAWAKKDKQEILKAFEEGKNYVVIPGKDGRRFVLDDFSAADENSKERVLMGGILRTARAPVVRFRLAFSDGSRLPANIMLIRNGKVVQAMERNLPYEAEVQDDSLEEPSAHYRVVAYTEDSDRLLSNPVFVRRPETPV